MSLSSKFGAALIILSSFAVEAHADSASTVQAAGKDANWLLIQTANAAEFDGQTLTLKALDPNVLMFTDRPARMAKTVTASELIENWNKGGNDSMQADPPNAGVTGLVDGKLQTATVELSRPELNGTTLTYQVKILEGSLPAQAADTSIFIDDIHWNPGGF